MAVARIDVLKDPEVVRRRERERVMVEEGIQLWRRQKEEQWQQRRREQSELKEMLAKYYPWGRPGCGAPNPDGVRKRKLELEGLYPEDYRGWSDETTLRTLDTRQRDPGPQPTESCADLVALLARKRPPSTTRFPLPSTDVTEITKIKDGPGLWGSPEVLYSRELEQQVLTKRMIMQQERREDFERSQQHFETWQRYWGRPGHGAPKEVKVKGNLDMMLRHVPVK
ncbi:uncharacterized protein [Anabrus simplex]|uniref:uncharacterized protein n=1 Tax=Anabrus simplex TaxID=316456 RepID=UPI0035A2A231